VLLKVQDSADRDWDANRATEEGWSQKVLKHHIVTGLRARVGAATNNVPTTSSRPTPTRAGGRSRIETCSTSLPSTHTDRSTTQGRADQQIADMLRAFGSAVPVCTVGTEQGFALLRLGERPTAAATYT
jgi:hypothetical protein